MSPSKSTDKLQILCDSIRNIPPQVIQNVKSISLTWDKVNTSDDDPVLLPVIKCEFYGE